MRVNLAPHGIFALCRRHKHHLRARGIISAAWLLLIMAALSEFTSSALSAEVALEGSQTAKGAGGGVVYGLASIPFFVRDMLILRSLAIGAGGLVIGYNLSYAPAPNWILLAGMSVIVAVNVILIAHLLWEKRKVSFNKDEQELFETLFRAFTPVEFMKLMRVGDWQTAQSGKTLTREGENLEELLLIGHGEVVIERDGEEIAKAGDGAIIGEMSFLQGGGASATVRTGAPTSYIVWPTDGLRKLLRRNPTMDVAMRSVLSMDLVHKLEAQE